MLTGLLKKEGTEIEPRLIGEAGKNTLLACYRVGLYVEKRMISSGNNQNDTVSYKTQSKNQSRKALNARI